MTTSTQDRAAALLEEIRATRDHESAIKTQSKTHEETWGKGPPFFSPATFAFWQQVSKGQFHIARCSACEHKYFPPRVICPACWAADTGVLQETRGEGKVFSFTESSAVPTRVIPIAPVLLVAVDLDEGVRVLTWLMDTPLSEAKMGQRVRIAVEPVLERPTYVARRI
jgi:uncharacterized OB-fold protein